MLKLCDKTGFIFFFGFNFILINIYYSWTYSFNKTHCGSLLKIAWSSDSTILAGAGV